MNKVIHHGYTVFEDGKVISPQGKLIKPSHTKKGYLIVRLKVYGKWTTLFHHRFVIEAFEGKCPKGKEVHHRNGIRDDNRLSNLKYVTKSVNNQDSYDSGRRDVKGTNNANCNLTEEQVKLVCERLQENPSLNVSKLSREIGILRMTISQIKHRKQWTGISDDYSF